MKTVTQTATIQTKSTPIRKKLKDQNYRTLSTNLLRETNDLKTKIWKHELENYCSFVSHYTLAILFKIAAEQGLETRISLER